MPEPQIDTVVSRVRAPSLDDAPTFRHNSRADQAMRRLLRVSAPRRGSIMGAHRAFRWSIVVSGIRCLITYLAVPIALPLLSLAAWFAAPIGIVLCVIAGVNGVISVRRFWLADHRHRWMYTAFIGVVFVVLAIALTADILRILPA